MKCLSYIKYTVNFEVVSFPMHKYQAMKVDGVLTNSLYGASRFTCLYPRKRNCQYQKGHKGG